MSLTVPYVMSCGFEYGLPFKSEGDGCGVSVLMGTLLN